MGCIEIVSLVLNVSLLLLRLFCAVDALFLSSF